MAENYEVRAVLSAHDQNMSSTFDHLYNQSGSLMERLKGGIGFGAMASIGAAAIGTLTTAMGTFASSVMDAGSSFEASMSEVSAISGATGRDFEALSEKAKEMGATTKFTATESSQALKYMAMAGWKTEDMLGGLDGVMNLAAASGEDLATTSDIVTDALTAFGMKAEESGHFADILAATSSNANTNVSMLGESFKYVAPVAGSLGYSAEDVSLALGLMANSGIKASQSGTALRKMLNNMVSDNKEVRATMDELGISLTKENGEMKDLKSVMTDLRSAFSGLNESQKAATASTLAGTTGMSGLLAIVNASESDFKKLSGAIENCDGTAKQMADTMQDNLSGKMTILKSSMEGLGIAAYDHLSAPFQDAVEIMTGKVGDLTRSMEDGKLGEIMDSIGKGAKKAAKATGKAFDFIVDHGQDVIAVAGGISVAFASIRVTSGMRSIPGMITKTIGPLSEMSKLMGLGFGRTTSFLGVLEAGSGPLKNFAARALSAGGGLKGIASAALGAVTPLGAVAGVLSLAAGGVTAWMIANQDLLPSNAKVLKQAQSLKDACSDYSESVARNREEREKSIETSSVEVMKAEELSERIEQLAGKTNKSASEKAYLKSMIDELNSVIPDLNLNYDEETDKLNQSTEAIDNKIEAMQREAKIASLRGAQDSVLSDMADGQRELAKAQGELAEMQDGLAEKQKAYNDAYSSWQSAGSNATAAQTSAMTNAAYALKQQKDAAKSTQGSVDELTGNLKDLEGEYDSLGAKQQQVLNKDGWEDLLAAAEEAKVVIPESVKAGIEAGTMMIPATRDELEGLIDWDRLAQKAQNEGKEIPIGLARGIQEGTVNPVEAAEYLSTILSDQFQGLEAKAKAHGFSIPEKMAEGIQDGSVNPQEAINYVNQRINDYEPAVEELTAAGYKIPESISTGINEGTISVQEAVAALKEPIIFDDLSTAAASAGVTIPSNLAQGIQDGSLSPQEAAGLLMESMSIQMNRPDIGQISGQDLMAAYNAAIEGGATGSEAAAAAIAQVISGGLSNVKVDAENSGAEVPSAVAGGMTSNASQTQSASKSLADMSANAIKNTAVFSTNGQANGRSYVEGVGNQAGHAMTAGTLVKNSSTSATAGGYSVMYSNGAYNGVGYVQGIQSQVDAAYQAGAALGNAASQGARDATKVQSPSRVFMKIGHYVGEGFAIGIESMAGEVSKATEEMISIPDQAISSMSGFSLPAGSFEQSSKNVLIEVPIELDGRTIAKGSASFMKEELDRREKLSIRMAGG